MGPQKSNVARKTLYGKVWSEPISRLAATFGVSGTYLARICRELNIPTPGRGYWAQLKAGKNPPQAALPNLKPGDPSVWTRSNETAVDTDTEMTPPDFRSGLPARRRSDGPHGLLLDAKEIFAKAKPSYSSIYLSPRHRKLADLVTTETHLEKTILLAQRLFSRLEDYGYRVSLARREMSFGKPSVETDEVPQKAKDDPYPHYHWRPDPCTVAYLGTVAVGLIVVEMTQWVERKNTGWVSTVREGSGRYRIYAYSPYKYTQLIKSWQDTKEAGLSQRLDEIIGEMEAMARDIPDLIVEGEKKAAAERLKRDAEHREYRRKQDLEARAETKAESLTSLKELISRWAEVRSQQEFLNELSTQIENGEPEAKNELLARLDVAKSLLGQPSVADLIRSWKTPEERYAKLPQWRKYEDQ